MTAIRGAVASKGASASVKLRPGTSPVSAEHREQHRARIFAGHMADGCPSLIEAASRMRITIVEADRLWKRIKRDLGWQAR